MEIMKTPYRIIRNKLIFELLDKYPDASTRTIARIVYNDNPILFNSTEDVRNIVRRYRGAIGIKMRNSMKLTKYFKNESMAGVV